MSSRMEDLFIPARDYSRISYRNNSNPYVYISPQDLKYSTMSKPLPFYKSNAFQTTLVAGILMLMMLASTSSIVVWFLTAPEIPAFHLNSLCLYNTINQIGKEVTRHLDVTIDVTNPNKLSGIDCENFNVSLIYEDGYARNALFGNFSVQENERRSVNASFVMKQKLGDNIYDIIFDQDAGHLEISLYGFGWIKFKKWKIRKQKIRFLCKKMLIKFTPHSPVGRVANNQSSECLILV